MGNKAGIENGMKRKRFTYLAWVLVWIIALSPKGSAVGLQAEITALQVGDMVTVHYSADHRIEGVGAITVYLNYDPEVLRTESIQTQTESLLAGEGVVSCLTGDDAESGTITGSWTETDCAMVLEEGTELMSVTFRVTEPIQESRITVRSAAKGKGTDGSIGNDDLGSLTGEEGSVLVITGAEALRETEAGGGETAAGSVSEGSGETAQTLAENKEPIAWLLAGAVLAAIVGTVSWFAVKRRRRKQV